MCVWANRASALEHIGLNECILRRSFHLAPNEAYDLHKLHIPFFLLPDQSLLLEVKGFKTGSYQV